MRDGAISEVFALDPAIDPEVSASMTTLARGFGVTASVYMHP